MYRQLSALLVLALIMATGQASAQTARASLNHIALMVNDLKVSGEFYREVVGLDTIPEPFHDGKHTWFSIGPKSHLHIISGGERPTGQVKGSHLCFTVPSVDEFVRKLNMRKIAFEDWAGKPSGITTRTDGVKQVYFRDPDGYWLEINDARD